jgi:transcriptional regulator GlxA family with amidase domain
MRHVRIWVYDGILASGVAGSIDVLTAANAVWADKNGIRRGAAPLFEWRIESLDGSPVHTASGQIVTVEGPINARTAADAVIVTAPFIADIERFFERPDLLQPLYSALRRQHARGALLASYCTGSFILAEAGLLDGGVATTHWAKAKVFAKRYPEVDFADLRDIDRAKPHSLQRSGDDVAQSRLAAGGEIRRREPCRGDRQDDADR